VTVVNPPVVVYLIRSQRNERRRNVQFLRYVLGGGHRTSGTTALRVGRISAELLEQRSESEKQTGKKRVKKKKKKKKKQLPF